MKRTILTPLVVAAFLQAWALPAFAQGAQCALLSANEIEAALGAKVPLSGGELPNGGVMCTGKSDTFTLTIRKFKRESDPSGEKEKKGIEVLRKSGATIETKQFGPILCMQVSIAGRGYSTSCTASKPPMFAVVESGSTKQAIPMDRLRPIAEKLLSRL